MKADANPVVRIKNRGVLSILHTFIYEKQPLILLCAGWLISYNICSQPYINTYVENRYVKQNSFFEMEVDTSGPPSFINIKDNLPQPIWPSNKELVKSYWKAWEIAFSNLKKVNKENGFVSPYIDPAFNSNIFMWDCSFMTMFGKYANRAFNFQNTLNNFYVKQHRDGFICREIRGSDGTDCFERFDLSSTEPNIMPWSEWEYYLNFNDNERLSKVFPVLLAYYQWYKTYRAWPDGTYYSSGWGCGMDNQMRMKGNFHPGWSHGFMSWIDISLQEVFSGSILVEMGIILQRKEDVRDIIVDIAKLKKHINTVMWNNKESFYFDRYRDGSLSTTKSIAAYWALLAGVVPQNKINNFVQHLEDTSEFARVHRVPTLSADNINFDPEGDYWNGSVWAPTNYMVLRGLTRYKKDSLAFEIAVNHLNNVVEVFKQTNTLWENYAPDKVQGNDKNNFVGWTGLVPISVLFEYVFGFRPNVPENTLVLDVRLTDEYGIDKYPYGKTGRLNILVEKRKNTHEKPKVTIQTNVPLNVVLKWDGGELFKEIDSGEITL